jgi:hypothetical protein
MMKKRAEKALFYWHKLDLRSKTEYIGVKHSLSGYYYAFLECVLPKYAERLSFKVISQLIPT